jgi:N-acetylmuramoyl-L-alanine amidase
MIAITTAFLDNYNRPNRKLKILKGIIIHWTANTSSGANAIRNRNYFNTKPFIKDKNGDKVFASAHYVVDDHSIVQCLPDDEEGFHVGAKWASYKPLAISIMNNANPGKDSPNKYLIGIEMCVNTDGDFAKTKINTIELTRSLMAIHNLSIDQVHRHFDITGKLCPMMYIDESKWAGFKAEISGQVSGNITPAGNRGKVNTATLNVRSGSGTQFSIVRKLNNGAEIDLLETKDKWYRIGNNEWVHSDYVIPISVQN